MSKKLGETGSWTHTRVDGQNKHDPRVQYHDIRQGHHVNEKGT